MSQMNLNEEDLREEYQDRNFSALDMESLKLIHDELVSLGHEPEYTETGTLRIMRLAGGNVYGVMHFVSAREVFYQDEYVTNRCQKANRSLDEVLLQRLQQKQGFWTQEDDSKLMERHLYVVDCQGVSDEPQYGIFRYQMEQDFRSARKVNCSLQELGDAMSSAFAPLAQKANAVPVLYVTSASGYYEANSAPDFSTTVTHFLRPQTFLEMTAAWTAHAQRQDIYILANKLFTRIMGSDYRMIDVNGELQVARNYQTSGIEFDWLGRGEQTMLALSLFLAMNYHSVTEGMCIGIRESLNAVDDSRHWNACDCLCQFVEATGASVYIQTDNKGRQHVARKKLENILMRMSGAAPVQA